MVSDETMEKYCGVVNLLRSLPDETAVYFTPAAKEILSEIVVMAKCGHGRVEEETNPNGTTRTTFFLEKDSAV